MLMDSLIFSQRYSINSMSAPVGCCGAVCGGFNSLNV